MSDNIGNNPFEDAFEEMIGGTAIPSAPVAVNTAPAPTAPVSPDIAPSQPMAPNPTPAPQPAAPPPPTAPTLDLGSEDDAPDELANFANEMAVLADEEPSAAPEPPHAPTVAPEPAPMETVEADNETADNSDDEIENPLEAAIDAIETGSIFSALPVFEYGAATEPIEDLAQTFDALRIAKAADFPELEDGNRVTWNVTYGKVVKTVLSADAKKKKIGEFKAEIERSKPFMDALKKSKDKNPRCVLKPTVKAQSKGKALSPYKGVYADVDEAEDAGKLIAIVPGRDGNVYEIRNSELGTFTTRTDKCIELSDIRAGFTPALPLVPWETLLEIITFFREQTGDDGNYEALANILWDRENEEFVTYIPQQIVTRGTVVSDLSDMPDADRYLHYMDIHSHNTMPARFSATDDADEKATRVYAVIGRLDSFMPDISVRISNGGKYLPIDASVVFERFDSACPDEWAERITVRTPAEVYRREI